MSERKKSTLAALLEEKPKKGRPPRPVSRKNVYVALTPDLKQQMDRMADELPGELVRADIPDIAINLLTVRMELLRKDVADRDREIPEGVTDLDSLYLLWDLPIPPRNGEPKWTSIRLSPQQAIELGRIHGVLRALFGANRSQVYWLSLTLLDQFLESAAPEREIKSVHEAKEWMKRIYL